MKALYQISAILGVICPLITCASFYYCKSSIKPPLSNKPLPPPPPLKGRKLISAPTPISLSSPPFPSPFLFFTSNE